MSDERVPSGLYSQVMWRARCSECGRMMGDGDERDYTVWAGREEAVAELRELDAVVTPDNRVLCPGCLESHPRLVSAAAEDDEPMDTYGEDPLGGSWEL